MNMKAEEKAFELINKFYDSAFTGYINYDQVHRRNGAKKCALIYVEEIMKVDPINLFPEMNSMEYWLEVKTEIEKL